MKIEFASFRNKVRKILSNFPNLNPDALANEIVAAAEGCIGVVEEPRQERFIPDGAARIDGHLVAGVRVDTLCGKIILSQVPVAAHHDTKGEVHCKECLGE